MDFKQQNRSLNDLKEQLRRLTDENLQLRDQNERLLGRVDSLQRKLEQLAGSKTDLSGKLVLSEQEKLRISKELVELQIAANKERERYEAETFELKTKVLSEDGVVLSLEAECDRLRQEVKAAAARLQVSVDDQRELEDEYAALKRNFLCVCDAHEREVTNTQELSAELLDLAHAHDTLLRERERMHTHALEVERVRQLVSRVSEKRIRPEELTHHDQTVRKNLQDGLREELERMRRSHEEQQRRLETRIVAMGKEQQENKREIHSTQHQLSQQSVALINSEVQLKELESENNKLQNHLKQLNQEYRARLTHYIQDITQHVCSVNQSKGRKLREFVDSMLEEVRASYRSREQQLTSAVRMYRRRVHTLTHAYQGLLSVHRMPREQVIAQTERVLNPDTPEAGFSSGGAGLKLQKLQREDKERLERQLIHSEEQVCVLATLSSRLNQHENMGLIVGGAVITMVVYCGYSTGLSDEAWNGILKQLTEIINTTQEGLERERAQLITRATVAEEQVSELQEYIDNHLGRYKLEVTRLRRMLGMNAGRTQSAGLPKPRPLHRPIQKTSYEI
ncbi:coiled-coil domain-containing protein 78 [Chanos chanos]|uniref:Coiled-coil domain-containing protein 78 n=1 Tax=Chanos chanos TaxID=29144 RepID=A0A6J2V196_CHACN|nr:coiled-coil domain-containing protein 78 [Chanos chanos]